MLDAGGPLRHSKFNGLPEIADELLMSSNEWRSARPKMPETRSTSHRAINCTQGQRLLPFNCAVEPFISYLKQSAKY